MSSVGSVGNAITNMMIAVRVPPNSNGMADAQLRATLERIAMQLYSKAHLEAPPSATDFGGGTYNILV